MIKNLLNKQIASLVVAVLSAATLYAQSSVFQTQFAGNDDASLRTAYNYTGPVTDTSGEYAKIYAVGGGRVTFTFSNSDIFGSDTNPEGTVSIVARCDGQTQNVVNGAGNYSVSFDINTPSSTKDVNLVLEATVRENEESEAIVTTRSYNSLTVYPLPSVSSASNHDLNIAENDGIDFSTAIPTVSGANGNWQFECTDNSSFAQTNISGNTLYISGTSPEVTGDVKKVDEYTFSVRYLCPDPINNDASRPWLSATAENVATFYVYNRPAITFTPIVYHLGNDTYSFVTNTGMNDEELAAKEYQFQFDHTTQTSRKYSGQATSFHAIWTYNLHGTDFRTASNIVQYPKEYTISNEFTYELEKGNSRTANYQPVYKDGTWYGWTNDKIRFNYHPTQEGVSGNLVNAKLHIGDSEIATDLATTAITGQSIHVEFNVAITVETSLSYGMGFTSDVIENAFQIYEPAVAPTIAEGGDKKAFDNETATLGLSANAGSGSNGDWRYSWTRKKIANGATTESQLAETGLTLASDGNITIDGERKETNLYEYVLHYANIAPDGETVWAEGDLDMGSLTVYNVPKAPNRLKQYQIGENTISVMDFDKPETPYDSYSFIDNRTDDFINNKPYYENIARGLMEGQVMWTYPDNTVASSPVTSFNEASDKFTASAKIEIKGVNYTGATNGFSFTGAQNYNNRWYGLVGSDIQLSTSFAPIDIQSKSYTLVNGVEVDAMQMYHPTAAGDYAYTYNQVYTIPLSDGSVYEAAPLVSEPANLTLYDVPSVPTAIRYDGSLQRSESIAPALRFDIDRPSGGVSDGWIIEWAINGAIINGEHSTSYTDTQVREVEGYSKKIDEYSVSVSYANVGPNGSNWITGNYTLPEKLKVYNEPNAIGRVAGYKTDESNFVYVAQNLGLTDEHLSGYDFYYDGTQNVNGRYLPDNIRPSQMWTQFVYDDGFTTASTRTAADAQLVAPTVELIASANGSGLEAPIVNGVATDNTGLHHCLPGARIALSTNASLENATFVSSSYSVNGESFNGIYVVSDYGITTDALFRDIMTFSIIVDSENGTNTNMHLGFNSGDFNLAKFYPSPVIPTSISYNGSLQRTESEAPALKLIADNPSGANDGAWTFQWKINGDEITGETTNTYTDVQIREVSGYAKKIDEYSFAIRYTNIAPNGDEWVKGEISFNELLKIYNEPNVIGDVMGYKTDESTFQYIACNLGLTDNQLLEEGYLFEYTDGSNGNSRYLPENIKPAEMWTQFVYDDGFSTVSMRTTAETQLQSPTVKLEASANGSGLAAPIVNGVATDNNGLHHCLPGVQISLSTDASLANASKVSSSYSVNGVPFEGSYTVTESDTETDALFRDMMTFNITVDESTTKSLIFNSGDFNLAKFYPTPIVPSEISYTGSMQRTESAAPALNMTVNNPSGANNGGWSLQWTLNGIEISGETANSHTDNVIRSVDGSAKKIDEYGFAVRYTNTAPNGDVWVSGETRLGDLLKVYNEPNAIGRVVGYKTDESNFVYIAQDLGLTDEHLSDYNFIYDENYTAVGRYVPENIRPSQMWTQFVYDDGFITTSTPTAADTQLIAPTVKLTASADGSGLEAPIINGVATDNSGFHHCLPGARISLSTAASLENAVLASSAYTVNGEQFDGTYTVPDYGTEIDAQFCDMMTFNVVVDNENGVAATKDLLFNSGNFNLAKFYPSPIYPAFENSQGNQQYRDIDPTNYIITATAPSGANASGWDFQWKRDNTILNGQTSLQYVDKEVYDLPEDSKLKKNINFDLAFTNVAPTGNFNWIEGNLSVPGITIYNTPAKPGRVVSVKFGDRTETFPTNVGLTDDEASQKEYLFSFNNGATVQTSRYYDGDASNVASVWNYDDFVCISDATERTADGISELSFSDLTTSATLAISGSISDNSTFTATYTGPVEDSGSNIYYAIRGYDSLNNSAQANVTNENANNISLATKTSVSKDGSQVEKIDGLSYSATYVEPGVYTFDNIAELAVAVENNQQHALTFSVPGTHSIDLLVTPIFPTPKANSDSYFFDDTEIINLNASIESAANGNPTGWSTKWIVDNREVGQDEQLQYPIESNEKAVATHEVTFSFANQAPVGGANWIEGENTSFPPIVVFNVPEQPMGIGHFYDEGSQTDSYFAMNTGLTDDQLSNRKYQFCFNDGTGEMINSVATGRYFNAKQENKRPTTVSAVWVYSSAQGDSYDYTTKTRSTVNSIDEYSFTYKPKLDIARGNNSDEAMFPVIEVTANGLRQALSGVSLSYTPSVGETNGKALANFVIKTILSNGSSNTENGGDAFNLIASPGLYTLEQNVTAEIQVDNNQYYSIYGVDTSCDKVQIWECPIIETPAIAELGQWRDIDKPNLGSDGLTVNQPAGGNSNGWRYAWSRSDIENIGNEQTLAKDENSVVDNSDRMHSEEYIYSVKYTNVSPDEETAWYIQTVDIAKATVYNTPKQPGSFVFFNSNGAGDDKYIVKNLGLSDEQIAILGYNFANNLGNLLTSGSRYIVSGTPLNGVRSLWKYEDGYNALSDATSLESTELTATFAPTLNVEKGANENGAYMGAVRDNQGQFHALEGSDLKFEIELQNSDLDLSQTTLKVSDNKGNESGITPANDGNKVTFTYRMEDVATYSVSGDIDSRYVVDNYNEMGNTMPVYANLKSKADLSGFSIRTYPTPTLSVTAEGVSSSYKYRSIDTDIKPLNVTSAAGGNESWNYTWLKDNVEIGNTGISTTIDKVSFNNNSKEMKSAKYSVRVTDANPVNGEPWYDYTYDVSTISFYNTPSQPAKLINFVNGNNNVAFAANVGHNDADLSALEYEFIFDGTNNGARRSIGGRASEVRSTWKYADGFVCSSESTAATETIEPQITATASITDASYPGYTGSVKDSGENERYYSLPGAIGHYTFDIYGKDLSVKNNAITFMFDNGNTPAQNQDYMTEFNAAGVYDGQISATMVYNVETNQTIDLDAEFGLPTSALVEIMPAPVYPEIGTYVNQYRDVDTEFYLEPRIPASGANDEGWTYRWTDGNQTYGEKEFATIDIQDMAEDVMQAVKRNITMLYSNSAPNGQEWITGSLDFETYIYNTPKQPVTLTPKGNGTSNIYIVTNMGDNDETLKAKHYQFAFGDGSTSTPETSDVVDIEGRRWYKYESSPNDPWVYSLWKYSAANGIPAYDCYSDVTRIGEGSRSEISLRDLYAVDDEEITIFTAGGVRIDLNQTKKLSPGVYVVVHGTGDDTYSEKIVVK